MFALLPDRKGKTCLSLKKNGEKDQSPKVIPMRLAMSMTSETMI